MKTSTRIAYAWKAYAQRNELKPDTQKYWKAQHAFINGANSLTGDEGLPPIIQIYVMSGRDIIELTSDEPATA
jgi:hypothetical protein